MAKFYGKIGFCATTETPVGSGIWVDNIIERTYYGDIIKHNRKYESSGYVNDNINISNKISILADSFACDNTHNMRYVDWMNAKWKISDISVEYPRMELTIGGIYNG